MTEKRFTLAYEKGNWWAVRDGDITLWKEEVIGLLNELNDENEQLKQELSDLECEKERLIEQQELLIAECKHQSKQKHNLIKFLKGCGHSIDEIRQICNKGDVE